MTQDALRTPPAAAKGLITIPARRGKAIRVRTGDLVKIINTHGSQVVDTWALNDADLAEYMSMEHTRASLRRLTPRPGDVMVTNQRRPILSLETDTTPGAHDTLIAACDRYRYQQLGAMGHHDSCTDNLAAALQELDLRIAVTPCPFNLFMNISIAKDGRIEFCAPISRAGEFVSLRAQMDAILVFSACPQDMLPVNGENMKPTEAHLEVVQGVAG
jgi:uncharacterized protein YcgI (DUF1989 family)